MNKLFFLGVWILFLGLVTLLTYSQIVGTALVTVGVILNIVSSAPSRTESERY